MHVYVYSALAPENKIKWVMRNVFHSYGNIVVVLFGLVQNEKLAVSDRIPDPTLPWKQMC